MRDPAAIHTAGLGYTLRDAIADHPTLADFPTPGIVGRLARAVDSGIIYRDDASAWQVWVTPGGGGPSSFPLSEDDGTNTYTVHTDPGFGQVTMSNALDANSAETDIFSFVDSGTASGQINSQWPTGGNAHASVEAGSDFGGVELKAVTSTSDIASINVSADSSNTPTTSAEILAADVQILAQSGLGFRGSTPIPTPTVVGSRGGNAALASLLTALADYGLIINGTSP